MKEKLRAMGILNSTTKKTISVNENNKVEDIIINEKLNSNDPSLPNPKNISLDINDSFQIMPPLPPIDSTKFENITKNSKFKKNNKTRKFTIGNIKIDFSCAAEYAIRCNKILNRKKISDCIIKNGKIIPLKNIGL
jgi:hypothetical protein